MSNRTSSPVLAGPEGQPDEVEYGERRGHRRRHGGPGAEEGQGEGARQALIFMWIMKWKMLIS